MNEFQAKFNARGLNLWAAQTTPEHSHFKRSTKRVWSNKISFVSTPKIALCLALQSESKMTLQRKKRRVSYLITDFYLKLAKLNFWRKFNFKAACN